MRRKQLRIGMFLDGFSGIPPNTGVTYRFYFLSYFLSKLGHQIIWFIANRDFMDKNELRSLVGKHPFKIYIIPPVRFYSVKFIISLVKKENLDLIQFENSSMFLKIGFGIKKILNLPSVLEIHDIEATLMEGLGFKKNRDLMIKIQKEACRVADTVIAMTPADSHSLKELTGVDSKKLFLVPNGIDEKLFPYYGPNYKEHNLLFLGNMFYEPNKQAIKFIIDKLIPQIKKEVKDIKVLAIGMLPEEIRKHYRNNKNVIFTGSIDSIDLLNLYFKKATVGLCPVFAGSGMKVKILNYCASGLPVLTTNIGFSGYEKSSSIIIEDNIDVMAKKIIYLFENHTSGKKIGRQNRIFIEQNFSWRALSRQISDVYFRTLSLYTKFNGEKPELTNIPSLFWLSEGRHKKRVLSGTYVIKRKKISKIS